MTKTIGELEELAAENATRADARKNAGQGQVEALLAIYYQLQIFSRVYYSVNEERSRGGP